MAEIIEREIKVSRQIFHKNKDYDYGVVRVIVPRKYIGRRAKVIVLIK